MKKRLKALAAVVLGVVMLIPVTVFAENGDSILVSTEKVTLSSSEYARSTAEKDFLLKTYNDNGVTVYSIDVKEQEYRQSAMDYMMQLTGHPGSTGNEELSRQGRRILLPGESEYHEDTQYDGSAKSYAWKRNTVENGNNFEGAQASSWNGSEECDYIVLNQGIDVNGLNVSISWPPAISGNGKSGSWQSQPIYSNTASASFDGLKIEGLAYSCSFSESGDVYVGSRVYRPVTYIKFSYFS